MSEIGSEFRSELELEVRSSALGLEDGEGVPDFEFLCFFTLFLPMMQVDMMVLQRQW